LIFFPPRSGFVQQLHSPDGENRGGADAASLGGPLVMQVVGQWGKNKMIELEQKDTIRDESIEPPIDFPDFFEKSKGILCHPEEKFRDYEGPVLKPDTFRFAKWVKQKHSNIHIDVRSAEAMADLRSNDFWLPLVFLASDVSLPVYLNLVANYIYDMARGALTHDKRSVHLRAIHKSAETNETMEFSYDGSVDGLKACIKKIDLNKLMDK